MKEELSLAGKLIVISSCVCVCVCVCMCVCVYSCLHTHSVAQSCPTLCDPLDCNPPGSSVHGISQARILGRVAISFSRVSSWSRGWMLICYISCMGRQILHHCTTWEAQLYRKRSLDVYLFVTDTSWIHIISLLRARWLEYPQVY